jgi:uncharacterized protein YaeQ
MALPSRLYRFKIELSHLEKGSYHTLDFRVAQHPSENLQYLLTRVLAYALSFEEGLEFSAGGLADPESATISTANPNGGYKTWIEIGNPSARKVHKAAKAADVVKIFTYKDPKVLLNELASEPVYRREQIEIYSLASAFLDRLEKFVKKENRWTLIFMDGSIMLNGDDFSEQAELKSWPYQSDIGS